MSIKITKFKEWEKNTLEGFASILMTNIGLEIRDATIHKQDDKQWIGLPAKPYQDENGETKYSYIIKFTDKDRWDQFQKEALEALDEYMSSNGEHEAIPDDDIPF